jgi:hypothetical protein
MIVTKQILLKIKVINNESRGAEFYILGTFPMTVVIYESQKEK